MNRVRLPSSVLVLLAALAIAASPAAAGGGVGDNNTDFGYGKNVHYSRALKVCDLYRGDAPLRACLANQLFKLVLSSHDSADELPRIDAYVATAGGFVQSNCHILMHT